MQKEEMKKNKKTLALNKDIIKQANKKIKTELKVNYILSKGKVSSNKVTTKI